MAVQIAYQHPLDIDKRVAIGVSIPFNGGGVFKSTFSTKDQIKSNLINLLLTYKGERVLNPQFGADLPRLLFEPINNETLLKIENQIVTSVSTYIPEITITNIEITPDTDKNTIYVNVIYQLKLSGTTDNIIIDFSTLQ